MKMAASAAEETAELESKQKKGEKFLNKAARTVCYNARDGFWDCMTVGVIVLPYILMYIGRLLQFLGTKFTKPPIHPLVRE